MNNDSILYKEIYDKGMADLDKLEKALHLEKIDFEKIINIPANEIPSNMDAWDLLFAVIWGGLGTIISTSAQLMEFSERIHSIASTIPTKSATYTQKIIYALLGHSGDFMDKVATTQTGTNGNPILSYLSRSAKKIAPNMFEGPVTKTPHRIAWGHDIFSFKDDNPFKLMIEQKGLLRGILQAMKHLVADTFSRQGLPIPGHSWFDYLDSAGVNQNGLYDVAMKMTEDLGLSKQGCSFNLDAFNEMFSIHAQDIASQGLVSVLASAYFKARNINNNVRKVQFRLLTYSVNFYTSVIVGALKHGGIPHINWVALLIVIKNFAQLYITSNRETRALQRETEQIVASNLALESRVYATGKLIGSFNCSWDYIDEYERERSAAIELINIFEEV